MTLFALPSLVSLGVCPAWACCKWKNMGSDSPPTAPTVKKPRRLSGLPGQHVMTHPPKGGEISNGGPRRLRRSLFVTDRPIANECEENPEPSIRRSYL